LKKFLIVDKGFNPERVESGVKKIIKAQSQGVQSRLDSFFTGSKTVSSKAKEVESKSKPVGKKSSKKK